LTQLLVHEERRHADFRDEMPKQEALADFGRLQKHEANTTTFFYGQQQAPADLFVGEQPPAQEQQVRADCLSGLMMSMFGAAPADFLGGFAEEDTTDKTVG
jgi:hypothetical protein